MACRCRLRGITNVEAAEAYLPEFITDYNRRFARPPRETASAWRRAPRDLDRILACRYARVVARDNTVTLPGRWTQIPPGPGQRSWHACRVEVREQLDGRLLVFHHDRLIAEQTWDQTGFTLVPRRSAKPRRRGKLKIDLQESRRKPERPAPQPRTHPAAALAARPTNVRKPDPRHPWKRKCIPSPPPETEAPGRT